eukprot:CAMPEP_0194120032 /NCGR_PEP_ID=MMETSP0150-20130528/41716_1 /TAXON_ID=122233 /ORGANISM="Chaetoceros debilis, Strain MM31A-1" /LENGTH=88 /DNA_ID=CAMNT_0038811949 /DNA_START=37 /DNA_END=300 /DNA_ORIENTATION=+
MEKKRWERKDGNEKMGAQDHSKKKRKNGMRKMTFIVVFTFIFIIMPMMNHLNIARSFLSSYVDQSTSSPLDFTGAADANAADTNEVKA